MSVEQGPRSPRSHAGFGLWKACQPKKSNLTHIRPTCHVAGKGQSGKVPSLFGIRENNRGRPYPIEDDQPVAVEAVRPSSRHDEFVLSAFE